SLCLWTGLDLARVRHRFLRTTPLRHPPHRTATPGGYLRHAVVSERTATREGVRITGAMTEPRNPWWKRKRWIAALALWLALPVLYPFSAGPAEYAVQRGWVYRSVVGPYYRPLRWATRGRRVPWFKAYV